MEWFNAPVSPTCSYVVLLGPCLLATGRLLKTEQQPSPVTCYLPQNHNYAFRITTSCGEQKKPLCTRRDAIRNFTSSFGRTPPSQSIQPVLCCHHHRPLSVGRQRDICILMLLYVSRDRAQKQHGSLQTNIEHHGGNAFAASCTVARCTHGKGMDRRVRARSIIIENPQSTMCVFLLIPSPVYLNYGASAQRVKAQHVSSSPCLAVVHIVGGIVTAWLPHTTGTTYAAFAHFALDFETVPSPRPDIVRPSITFELYDRA